MFLVILNLIFIFILTISGYRYAMDVNVLDTYKAKMEKDRQYKADKPHLEFSFESPPKVSNTHRTLFYLSAVILILSTGFNLLK